ncbi:MAG: hypothetical protein ACP5N3_02985 [Candidatus Nanoarchaeia archaeon]
MKKLALITAFLAYLGVAEAQNVTISNSMNVTVVHHTTVYATGSSHSKANSPSHVNERVSRTSDSGDTTYHFITDEYTSHVMHTNITTPNYTSKTIDLFVQVNEDKKTGKQKLIFYNRKEPLEESLFYAMRGITRQTNRQQMFEREYNGDVFGNSKTVSPGVEILTLDGDTAILYTEGNNHLILVNTNDSGKTTTKVDYAYSIQANGDVIFRNRERTEMINFPNFCGTFADADAKAEETVNQHIKSQEK